MLSVELTEKGYLHLPVDLAQRYFPNDALVAMVRDGELWLLPTRGPAAGGLLLKQRNRQGDRSVLIRDVLPPDTSPGWRTAHWDDEHGALRVALQV
ncbi:MAG: hydrogenase maturation protease [Roseiflexus sp.]|nr:hydrogenase maturation protease [Roseiflexus sp.]MDW8144727.1 hydrogenase maturation protease [Roseiflexaceae bacterium]